MKRTERISSRKRVKNLLIPILFAITILLTTSLANQAYAATGIYVTTNPLITQPSGSNVCWAATSVSMVRTRGITTTINAHVVDVFGTYRDVARTAVNVQHDFDNLYNINAGLTGTMGFSTVQSNIRSNNPIWAGVLWRSGGGHAVAISGTDSSTSGLRIMDPIYGWQYFSYTAFKTNYQSSGYWSQSIYFI